MRVRLAPWSVLNCCTGCQCCTKLLRLLRQRMLHACTIKCYMRGAWTTWNAEQPDLFSKLPPPVNAAWCQPRWRERASSSSITCCPVGGPTRAWCSREMDSQVHQLAACGPQPVQNSSLDSRCAVALHIIMHWGNVVPFEYVCMSLPTRRLCNRENSPLVVFTGDTGHGGHAGSARKPPGAAGRSAHGRCCGQWRRTDAPSTAGCPSTRSLWCCCCSDTAGRTTNVSVGSAAVCRSSAASGSACAAGAAVAYWVRLHVRTAHHAAPPDHGVPQPEGEVPGILMVHNPWCILLSWHTSGFAHLTYCLHAKTRLARGAGRQGGASRHAGRHQWAATADAADAAGATGDPGAAAAASAAGATPTASAADAAAAGAGAGERWESRWDSRGALQSTFHLQRCFRVPKGRRSCLFEDSQFLECRLTADSPSCQALRAQQQAALAAQAQRNELLRREPPLHRAQAAPLFGTTPAARAAQPVAGRPPGVPLVGCPGSFQLIQVVAWQTTA